MLFRSSLYGCLTAALLLLPVVDAAATGEGVTLPAPDYSSETETSEAPGLPLEELRAFAEVLDRIRTAYVEEVDDRTLLESAIEGMLGKLDPHSSYLDEEAFRELQENTSGAFGGVGLEVALDGDLVRVVSPMDGTPAERAGILPGDLIVRIDDRPVRDMTLDGAIAAMRGEAGSEVVLTIRRHDVRGTLEMPLTRAVIEVASITSRMLEDGFGYIRIAQFQNRTGDDLARTVLQLREAASDGLHGLILDLRNNPGGVLHTSVAVANAFLEQGRIVYTEGRLSSAQISFDATGDDIAKGTPLVVLINEGSASAAEIVAGALQDHRRALVMGTPSFGKGSVQTVLPLSDERAIKLTTALYFTPSGRSIQAQGIVPDITVERGTVVRSEARAGRREADLPRHLRGDGPDPGNGEASSARESALASDDFQISEALNLLRGLHLLGRPGTAG